MEIQKNTINDTEKTHLQSINKIAALVLFLHIPVAMVVAYVFNMSIVFAILASLAISSVPWVLTFFTSSTKLAAISYGVAMMFFSGLIIHLSKGMIESHFHIFVSLAVLIVFANPFVILAAAGTIALHHVGFYFLLPASVFNYQASLTILVVHAGFVVLQTIPCAMIAEKFRRYIVEQGQVITQIEDIYNTMNEKINELTSNNIQLSESSDLQSSAVTQTAQTVHEISLMASQTSENAGLSKSISDKTKNSADNGVQIVNEVTEAMSKIKDSNTSVIDQITTNNTQLAEIVTLIKQIESKTSLINDIVFQTKLLSFNAAVEAARAGEHGKGFAVVAEEIGNLAMTSGAASKEISSIINLSVGKVTEIVSSTEVKVKELIANSLKNIQSGEDKARFCGETFTELSEFIKELNNRMNEISLASQEQSEGINEMTSAIQQLENSNNKNHESIKVSVDVSSHLSGLSNDLGGLVSKLNAKNAA